MINKKMEMDQKRIIETAVYIFAYISSDVRSI